MTMIGRLLVFGHTGYCDCTLPGLSLYLLCRVFSGPPASIARVSSLFYSQTWGAYGVFDRAPVHDLQFCPGSKTYGYASSPTQKWFLVHHSLAWGALLDSTVHLCMVNNLPRPC